MCSVRRKTRLWQRLSVLASRSNSPGRPVVQPTAATAVVHSRLDREHRPNEIVSATCCYCGWRILAGILGLWRFNVANSTTNYWGLCGFAFFYSLHSLICFFSSIESATDGRNASDCSIVHFTSTLAFIAPHGYSFCTHYFFLSCWIWRTKINFWKRLALFLLPSKHSTRTRQIYKYVDE